MIEVIFGLGSTNRGKETTWLGAAKPMRESMKRRRGVEIAAAILQECKKRGIAVSNLRLQKLLYYSEAWSLALRGESFFNDPIEAWVHGPVVADVFHLYKDSRWAPIAEAKTATAQDDEALSHIGAVIDAYGTFSASDLERLAHSENP